VPIKVSELEKISGKNSIRSKILEFLRKNSSLAFTLNEIYNHFLDLDKKEHNLYQLKKQIFYRMVYNYLRDFAIKEIIVHKGNYYFYKKNEKEK